ncbi:hypothetical protein DPEC_G00072630 [Dallia pectoralis]|uniref:Uncharacterized protein n=1 Tax=Dallia pectoralis TaxID=75939 RepID=A0ACC2H2K7_DALPE|nr:hypothetical protein DPEC_G00072630 [Dallia pectoralis]
MTKEIHCSDEFPSYDELIKSLIESFRHQQEIPPVFHLSLLMDVTYRAAIFAKRTCALRTFVFSVTVLSVPPFILLKQLTPMAMGERLQAVSSGVWVTKGREVYVIPPPVPVPQPVTTSQRAAATAIVCRTPKEHQASTTQVLVPQLLLLHTIGRFVFRIFPLTIYSPWLRGNTKNTHTHTVK